MSAVHCRFLRQANSTKSCRARAIRQHKCSKPTGTYAFSHPQQPDTLTCPMSLYNTSANTICEKRFENVAQMQSHIKAEHLPKLYATGSSRQDGVWGTLLTCAETGVSSSTQKGLPRACLFACLLACTLRQVPQAPQPESSSAAPGGSRCSLRAARSESEDRPEAAR